MEQAGQYEALTAMEPVLGCIEQAMPIRWPLDVRNLGNVGQGVPAPAESRELRHRSGDGEIAAERRIEVSPLIFNLRVIELE